LVELRALSSYDRLRQHGFGLRLRKTPKKIIDERVHEAAKSQALTTLIAVRASSPVVSNVSKCVAEPSSVSQPSS
jgi:hypothetical protein